jgi:hypothetical protein
MDLNITTQTHTHTLATDRGTTRKEDERQILFVPRCPRASQCLMLLYADSSCSPTDTHEPTGVISSTRFFFNSPVLRGKILTEEFGKASHLVEQLSLTTILGRHPNEEHGGWNAPHRSEATHRPNSTPTHYIYTHMRACMYVCTQTR